MEHRLLEYFLTVAEELHFTRAADKLGISQPTLSHQIRLLEHELGTPLFHRSGKKNHLTQAGQVLMEHARRIFFELEQAKLEIGDIIGRQRGRLRIGCSGNHLLTSALISFHRKYPGIELTVIELATEETCDGLLNNQLDIGVVFLPLDDERLVSIPLYDEELVAAVSPEHPFAARKELDLHQLGQTPLILFPKKFLVRQMIDTACNQIGITLQPVMELSTMESQLQMAEYNVGAAIFPRSYAETIHHRNILFLPITEPAPRKSVGIVYRKDFFMDTTIQAFIEQLSR